MNRDQELTEIERTLWTNDRKVYGGTVLADAVIIFPEVGWIDLKWPSTRLGRRMRPDTESEHIADSDVQASAVKKIFLAISA